MTLLLELGVMLTLLFGLGTILVLVQGLSSRPLHILADGLYSPKYMCTPCIYAFILLFWHI